MKDQEVIKKADKIAQEMVKMLGIEAEVKTSMEADEEDKKYLSVVVEGEDLGGLIGYKGRNLNSFQLLYAQILSNEVGEPMPVVVDVNNYRQRRKEYLISLAHRAMLEVRESGQQMELPPLSPFERRIIHIALKKEEGVRTESEGEGVDRHIIIYPDSEPKK